MTPPLTPHSRTRLYATLATAALLAATTLTLRLEGRRWWCAQGDQSPWISNVWSSHCSQHLLDPYSLTHISHGLIFYFLFRLLAPRLALPWRFALSLTLAAGWEVLENSALIVNRYREATMSYDYLGDSVTNSLGDILSCAIGFLFAKIAGFRLSLALFIATELLLLWLIRDNLTLNVIMLAWPIEAIKHWQSAGHSPA
jgi:hypothetical protein